MSTILKAPRAVRMVTRPEFSLVTLPITLAPMPAGLCCIAVSSRSASSGAQIASSFPSFAMYSGSRPSNSQAPRTSGRSGDGRFHS